MQSAIFRILNNGILTFFVSQQIEMKFNEPFFGLAYADFDRNSACQVLGKGDLSYRLELPLKGCGTKQVRVTK